MEIIPKIKVFEKCYFENIFSKNLKSFGHKKCCNCKKELENIKLISNCTHCKKNYCFNCFNNLYFSNYFTIPNEKYLNDFMMILFHSIDRPYFDKMCCKKSYFINFIPNKISFLNYFSKNNYIHKSLAKINIEIIDNTINIDKLYYKKLNALYKYTNNIFWNTYLLIKRDIPLDIIFLILKYNINYINFKY